MISSHIDLAHHFKQWSRLLPMWRHLFNGIAQTGRSNSHVYESALPAYKLAYTQFQSHTVVPRLLRQCNSRQLHVHKQLQVPIIQSSDLARLPIRTYTNTCRPIQVKESQYVHMHTHKYGHQQPVTRIPLRTFKTTQRFSHKNAHRNEACRISVIKGTPLWLRCRPDRLTKNKSWQKRLNKSPAMRMAVRRERERILYVRDRRLPERVRFTVGKGFAYAYSRRHPITAPVVDPTVHELLMSAASDSVIRTRNTNLTSEEEIKETLLPVFKDANTEMGKDALTKITNRLIADRRGSVASIEFLKDWDQLMTIVVRICEQYDLPQLSIYVLDACNKEEEKSLADVRQSRSLPYSAHIAGLVRRDNFEDAVQVLQTLKSKNIHILGECFEPFLKYHTDKHSREGVLQVMEWIKHFGCNFTPPLLNGVLYGFINGSEGGLHSDNFDKVLQKLVRTIGTQHANVSTLQILLNASRSEKDINLACKALGFGLYTNEGVEMLTAFTLNWPIAKNPQRAARISAEMLTMVLERRPDLDGGESYNMLVSRCVELGDYARAYMLRYKPAFQRTNIWPSTIHGLMLAQARRGDVDEVARLWNRLRHIRIAISKQSPTQQLQQIHLQKNFHAHKHPNIGTLSDTPDDWKVNSRDVEKYIYTPLHTPVADVETSFVTATGGITISDSVAFIDSMSLLGEMMILDRYKAAVETMSAHLEHTLQNALLRAYLTSNKFDTALSLCRGLIKRNLHIPVEQYTPINTSLAKLLIRLCARDQTKIVTQARVVEVMEMLKGFEMLPNEAIDEEIRQVLRQQE